MTIESWLAFAAATLILVMIPGPTILAVISYSIAHGRRARWPLVLAVALGDSTALVLSLLGLGALLATSATLFTWVKWAGGLYLLFLGVKMIRAGVSRMEVSSPELPDSAWVLFFNTWLITALNPKGIIFFIAFLPQFIDPTQPALIQLWILSATFVCLAAANALFYAQFAQAARSLLASPKALRRFNISGGCMLSAAGIWTLNARLNN